MTTARKTIGKALRRLASGKVLMLVGLLGLLTSFAIPPTTTYAFEGDYRLAIKLSNPRGDLKITATRDSPLSPVEVEFATSNGTDWTSTGPYIARTNTTVCNMDRSSCTWRVSVKDGNNEIASAGPQFIIGQTSAREGTVAHTFNITVPPKNATPTTGSIAGKGTFVNYMVQPNVTGNIPKNVPIRITQTAGGNYTAETFPNDQGAFIFHNVPPGTYTVRANGGYVNGSTTIPIDTSTTGITVFAGREAAATLHQGATGPQSPPPTTTNPDDNEAAEPDPCLESAGAWGWAICPMNDLLSTAAGEIDEWITSLLKVNACRVFNTSTAGMAGNCSGSANEKSSSDAFYTAWKVFRSLAYALLVILGLVMIISQIAGLELFGAYTIRKMLPKLVIAAIVIPLLWPLLRMVTVAANDSADAVSELIKAPFMFLQHNPTIGDWFSGIGIGVGVILGAIAVVQFGAMGVVVALLATVAIALFQALVVLAIRDMAFFLLVIASPVAIVLGIFEPFKKGFSLWRRFLAGILLSIPAIAAVLAMSKVAAALSRVAHPQLGIFFALLFIIVGYMLFWPILKSLDRLSGQIDGAAGKATGWAQNALSKYRGDTVKKRFGEGVSFDREFKGPAGWATSIARRAKLSGEKGVGAGAFGIGKKGRAGYQEAVKGLKVAAAARSVERDKGRGGGDDDAMRLLLQRGMTEDRFLREYAAQLRDDKPEMTEKTAMDKARTALALSQTSFGAAVGTDAMRVAAAQALLKSNTSYRKIADRNPDGSIKRDEKGRVEMREMTYQEMTEQMYGDIGALVKDKLITSADGASIIKSNGARADRAGVGFGTVMSKLELVADDKNKKGAAVLGDVADADTGRTHGQVMADEALSGTGPQQLELQRHEALRLLGPEMLRGVKASWASAVASGRGITPELVQKLATGKTRREIVTSSGAELNTQLNAEGYSGQNLELRVGDQTIGIPIGEFEEVMTEPLVQRAADGTTQMHPMVGKLARVYAPRAEQQLRSEGATVTLETIDARARGMALSDLEEGQKIFRREYRREWGTGWQAQASQAAQPRDQE